MIKVTKVYYELPDDLHRRVKLAAAVEGRTLKGYLIRALTTAVGVTEQEHGVDLAAMTEREQQASEDG